MTLPATYKQAAFKGLGKKLTFEEVPMKQPAADEVLIKVEACGICHSDVYAQYNGYGTGFPVVPGHEVIGRIVAVGTALSDKWKVGDRVGAGWHGGHDGTCTACKKGWFQGCDNAIVTGVTRDGGYAEYTLLRSEALIPIPPHVSAAKYAPLLCAGVTVFNSIRNQHIPQGATVAIQGLGGLGHLAIQYARRMGYRVIAISRGTSKQQAARTFGASAYIDSTASDAGDQLKALGGASLIVTTAEKAEAISPLIKGLSLHGKLLLLSLPGTLEIDTLAMIKNALSVQVWASGHAGDSAEAVEFAELNGIDCVIETYKLEDAQRGYDDAMSGKSRFRAVLTME